jgi:hypothetical protein
VLRVDSPALVRHIPRELDGLLVAGEPAAAPARSALWASDAMTSLLGITPRTRRRG